MKKYLLIIAAMIIAAGCAYAQSTNTFTLQTISSVTNWVAIPYLKYDVNDHTFGYGGALLYKVSPNFYTGMRFDQLNGRQTTAGVQAQLQATITIAGITSTPFVETSVGIGSTSLYGSTGPGIFLDLYDHEFHGGQKLTIGLVGDYEHVINGNQNYNSLNAGPLFNLSF